MPILLDLLSFHLSVLWMIPTPAEESIKATNLNINSSRLIGKSIKGIEIVKSRQQNIIGYKCCNNNKISLQLHKLTSAIVTVDIAGMRKLQSYKHCRATQFPRTCLLYWTLLSSLAENHDFSQPLEYEHQATWIKTQNLCWNMYSNTRLWQVLQDKWL